MLKIIRNAVAGVALAGVSLAGCADTATTAGEGQLEVNVGALEYLNMMGAEYTISVYEQSGTMIWSEDVDTAEFGAPNGSLLYVGPCVAGSTGTATNTVIVKLRNVYDDAAKTPVNGLNLPPAASLEISCEENKDVRAAFEFVVARSAEQGFADVTVDIDDIFCAAKVDCQTDLMPDPDTGDRGPTLVTGFACTGGADTDVAQNFVGFTAEVCCDFDGVEGEACTSVNIDDGGTPNWSTNNAGITATQSYFGAEDILGKVYHNTSWLIAADAPGFQGCTLKGFGFFNSSDSETGPALSWNAGDTVNGVGSSPAFHFYAEINSDGWCDPSADDTGVEWNFSAERGADEDAQPPTGGSTDDSAE